MPRREAPTGPPDDADIALIEGESYRRREAEARRKARAPSKKRASA